MRCRDQRLYKQSLGKTLSAPDAITPADAGLRYADAVVDEKRNRLIAVQEDHSGKGEAVNTVASVGAQAHMPGCIAVSAMQCCRTCACLVRKSAVMQTCAR